MSQQSESSTDTGQEESEKKDSNFTIVTRNKRKKRTKGREDPAKKVDNKKSPEIRLQEPQLPINSETTHEANVTMETDTSEVNNPTTQTTTKQLHFYKTYENLFHITALPNTTRLQIADQWMKLFPNGRDIITQTTQGFIIKSNNSKDNLIKALKHMKETKQINTFCETSTNTSTPNKTRTHLESFSAVISHVEIEIKEEDISKLLMTNQITHRYCKRIISRKTNQPSLFIRIITSEVQSYERLIKEGIFFKCRHYTAKPSYPPDPIPIPCAKCSQFTHTTIKCNSPIICSKCGQEHKESDCTTSLPPRCSACQSTEHVAWSLKCPKRPVKPIEGIPNIKIRSINKKTADMDIEKVGKSRIHRAITIHDHIIETYINKINKPKNTERQQLIQKLQRRFIDNYNISTVPTFVGNRLYILMIDLENENKTVDTEPAEGVQLYGDIHS